MHVELGEFVVMPNHIHGIIIIGANDYNSQCTGRDAMPGRDAMHCVSTTPAKHPAAAGNTGYKNQFIPQSKNLSSIVRGYKSAVTTYARKNNLDFGWQPRFYDHIIRSMESYRLISHYILNNPARWNEDKFYQS